MNKIEITDAGPIEGTFDIDLSEGPGVYELRGARGSGKTTCINSIDWLVGHKVDITLHDGAVSGKVEGFGVVAPIGGKKRRKGEFDLDTIDAEKFSITDILDPQGKTPEVRDATRIKALAVLSGCKADPKLYYELAGGQAALDALDIEMSEDPVVLATRIKTAYDKLARAKEYTAEAEGKHAAPLEHVPEGLNLKWKCDLNVLGEARDAARDTFNQLTKERADGLERRKRIAEAKEKLETVKAAYTGPTVPEAELAEENSVTSGRRAKERVQDLERQLAEARTDLAVCVAEYTAAHSVTESAKSHAAAIEGLEIHSSETVEVPEPDEIDAIGDAVDETTQAYDAGLRIRDVKNNQAKAEKHREAEKAARQAADAARNNAAKVFDVLATSIDLKHMQIRPVDGNPRLFVTHSKRKKTLFDQVNGLSDGERVDFTLRELLPHITSPGLLPIPQRVWQDLQPSDRDNLHKLAVDKGLYLFGAQVDDGDLRVVFYGNGDK